MAGGAATTGVKAAGPALSKRQEYFAFGLITSLFFVSPCPCRGDVKGMWDRFSRMLERR